MEISFYNIFLNTHINTEYFDIQCMLDSENIGNSAKKQNQLTHVGKLRGEYNKPSILRDEGIIIDDLGMLLSIALGNQVFSDSFDLGRIGNNKTDVSFLMQEDIEDFIDTSLRNLQKMSPEYQNILKTAIHMYYQIKYYLWFDDLRSILLMNCFEFLLASIYRIDKKEAENDIYIGTTYTYILDKFGYQKLIDDKLTQEVGGEHLKKFKKEKNIKKISSFGDQFSKMRNWLAHGKNYKKPVFTDSPSDIEFTFTYRIDSFIRIILLDMIYGKDYERKFDILYQLILEKNVRVMVTPDHPVLRFQEIKRANQYI